MKNFLKLVLPNGFVFFLILAPMVVLAQSDFGLQNPIGVNSISELIVIVVKVIRYIAIPFVVIMIMYAGFQYIWAGYNGKVTATEHDTLKWIIIGAFIILSAEMIALVISNTLKQV